MRILLNAVSFGYGPISKIYGVAKRLSERGADIFFCGNGIAYEFMKREKICEVMLLDIYTEYGKNRLVDLASKYDYGLTCMDPVFIKHTQNLIKQGYVDSLGWMWDKGHFENFDQLRKVDHYFVQNSFDAFRKIINHQVNNPIVIGSIIDLPKKIQCKLSNDIVIHFGGVENIYVPLNKIQYPFKMIGILNGMMDILCKYDNIYVVCSENVSRKLKNDYPEFPAQFVSLEHDEFIKLLSRSKLLITTPGLTTLLESFAMNLTTLFLPPQNYSQYLILNSLREKGYPELLYNWNHYYPDFNISENTSEEVAVNKVKELIDTFFEDNIQQNKLQNDLSSLINHDEKHIKIREFQENFINEIGTNGIDQIVESILGVEIIEKNY